MYKNVSELELAAPGDMAIAQRIIFPSRYQRPFVAAVLEATGVEIPVAEGRDLSVSIPGDPPVEVVYARGRDIPREVRLAGQRDPAVPTVGVTGLEMLLASGNLERQNLVAKRLGTDSLGSVGLLIPPNVDDGWAKNAMSTGEEIEVVTAYEDPQAVVGDAANVTLGQGRRGLVTGSTEAIAGLRGVPALDLVFSGETAAQNGFTVFKLLANCAVLVTNGQFPVSAANQDL